MTHFLIAAFVLLIVASGAPALAIVIAVAALVLVVASKWP